MRFLESALLRRVPRRLTAVEMGPGTKLVVFFSVAIGTPSSEKNPSYEPDDKVDERREKR